MIVVSWATRRWLWCDSCGQVAVLHSGDVCLRCIARMYAEHPELHDLDDVARELGVSLDVCRLGPVGWWCSRDGGHDGPCALRPSVGRLGRWRRSLARFARRHASRL